MTHESPLVDRPRVRVEPIGEGTTDDGRNPILGVERGDGASLLLLLEPCRNVGDEHRGDRALKYAECEPPDEEGREEGRRRVKPKGAAEKRKAESARGRGPSGGERDAPRPQTDVETQPLGHWKALREDRLRDLGEEEALRERRRSGRKARSICDELHARSRRRRLPYSTARLWTQGEGP